MYMYTAGIKWMYMYVSFAFSLVKRIMHEYEEHVHATVIVHVDGMS